MMSIRRGTRVKAMAWLCTRNYLFVNNNVSVARTAIKYFFVSTTLITFYFYSSKSRIHALYLQPKPLCEKESIIIPEIIASASSQQKDSFLQRFRVFIQSISNTISIIYRIFYLSLCYSPALITSPLILLGHEGAFQWWSNLLKACIEYSGPCFIKFAQWIATRPDLFPIIVCHTLEGLQSRSFMQSRTHIINSLRQDLGENLSEVVTLEDNCMMLGAGCVAQVALGQYRGKPAAVKVLHPRIKNAILIDLRIAQLLSALIESIPGVDSLSIQETVQEFTQLMLNQLDMNAEGRSLKRFRQNFNQKRWTHVSFPEVFYSSESVLIESYESGKLMSTELLDKSISSGDCKYMAQLGLDAFLKMIFEDNFVHADLHPGNIIVRRSINRKGYEPYSELQLIFIDAGLVVELESSDRKNFVDLFSAIVFNDGKAVGRLMIERGRGKGVVDREGFEAGIAEIVADVHSHGLNLGRISIGHLLEKVLVLCYNHKVKLESKFANLLLAIGVLEGLGRRLDPQVDLISRATPFIIGAVVY